jgi:DNA-binding NarL/FixJ family response regulator
MDIKFPTFVPPSAATSSFSLSPSHSLAAIPVKPFQEGAERVLKLVADEAVPAVQRAAETWGEATLKKGGLEAEETVAKAGARQLALVADPKMARETLEHVAARSLETLPSNTNVSPHQIMAVVSAAPVKDTALNADQLAKATGVSLAALAASEVVSREAHKDQRGFWGKAMDAALNWLSPLGIEPTSSKDSMADVNEFQRLTEAYEKAEKDIMRQGWSRLPGEDLTDEEKGLLQAAGPSDASSVVAEAYAIQNDEEKLNPDVIETLEKLAEYPRNRSKEEDKFLYFKYLILLGKGRSYKHSSTVLERSVGTLKKRFKVSLEYLTEAQGLNELILWAWKNKTEINHIADKYEMPEEWRLKTSPKPKYLEGIRLTRQETSILLSYLEGKTHSEIVSEKFLNSSGVSFMLTSINIKLGTKNLYETLAYVKSNRVLDDPRNFRLSIDDYSRFFETNPRLKANKNVILTQAIPLDLSVDLKKILQDKIPISAVAKNRDVSEYILKYKILNFGKTIGFNNVNDTLFFLARTNTLDNPLNVGMPDTIFFQNVLRSNSQAISISALIAQGKTYSEIEDEVGLDSYHLSKITSSIYSATRVDNKTKLMSWLWHNRETLSSIYAANSSSNPFEAPSSAIEPIDFDFSLNGDKSPDMDNRTKAKTELNTEIVKLIMEGYSYDEIARKLGRSKTNIRVHIEEFRLEGETTSDLMIRLFQNDYDKILGTQAPGSQNTNTK